MSVLNKFIGFLVDLLFRPIPSCKEKPLSMPVMIAVVISFLEIIFLLWITC